ncbi:Nose resistant to fluoxetine protein 6 [Toxocara canis]|uniref:Nose resistant to fluoxetine protein 6 n=1 Tax=Toxocara canis TaxID=6265 RepID=A0A0B2VD35_TOXCA|nr:Nose resistant to fluoxetine protein 6 [Toxocara canis]
MRFQFQIYSTILYALISHADGTVDSWQSFRRFTQGTAIDIPPPYNMSVISDEVCRNQTWFWLKSVSKFTTALTTTCKENDTECIAQRIQQMNDNLFAAQQVDSFGRLPSNVLGMNGIWQGSWEECVDVKAPGDPDYSTHFCWVSLATALTALSMGQSETQATCRSPLAVQWSICMPSTCENDDLTSLFRSMNGNLSKDVVRFCNVDCHPKKAPKRDAGFWIVSAYCLAAIVLMIVSSVIDYATESIGETNEVSERIRNKTWIKCLLTFSVYTNGAEILSVQKRPGQIECLHCIRALSMTWVICGHVLIHFLHTENMGELTKANKKFLNGVYTNPFFSVDSFLFLSGLLLSYLFVKAMDKNPRQIRSPIYWTLYYVHRILRLSPPYYLFIGFTTVMFDHFTVGPLRLDYLESAEPCRKTWWKNVLYINNLWDLQDLCMGHSWYLALDMQIYIFAPLLLIPLFYSPIAGGVSAFLIFAMSTAANYATFFKYDSPPSLLGFFVAQDTGKGTTFDFEQFLYFAPWIRCTPYVIGILTGYFLFKTKDKKLWMTWWLAVLLWLASAAIGVGCVFSLYDYVNGDPLNTAERASYYNWSRIGWAIGLAWVVTACERGWAGPIKSFMELGLWAPLSRLTYCGYLVHYFIIVSLLSLSRQPMHFVNMSAILFLQSFPVIVITFAVAFLWSCAFEIPSGKLEKMLISALLGSGNRRRGERVKPAELNEQNKVEVVKEESSNKDSTDSQEITNSVNSECKKDS